MDAAVEPTSRTQIAEEAKWDLRGLFASDQAWEERFAVLESRAAGYAAFQGTLDRGAGQIKACFDFDLEVSRQLDAIYTYAHLRNDEDKTAGIHQRNYEKAMRLFTQVQQARSFIAAELMAIGPERMREFANGAELEFYRVYLERILRYRPYTLSGKEEALLAGAAEMAQNAHQAFSMLDNADLDLGTVIDGQGRETRITHGNFASLLQNFDRRVRREAFTRFYTAYAGHRFTYSALLAGSLKKDQYFSRARNFQSVRAQALFGEDIAPEVYDNLVAAVRDGLAPLYKYFALRKRLLGLDELRVYDCSVPLAKDVTWDMDYGAAVDTILQALAPLGKEYVAVLEKGLTSARWVDRYETPGKRSGAYSSGCYDSNPFILMNYHGDNINSLYTLAHEAGHSMHSYYSKKHQPYAYADYTIFVAEVASTFNEALITRHLMNKNSGREMQIYLLCREIDNLRGTLYRQTMFAEFEHKIHASAGAGQPLTVEDFRKIYRELLEVYFGPGVALDECLSLECFRIPHFYSSFYVYKYATGISAAYALADRVLRGGEKELNGYLGFLKAGGSEFPLALLRRAGIDMASPQPIRAALNTFAGLVDRLEALAA